MKIREKRNKVIDDRRGKTSFQSIYDVFFTEVSDDMYISWSELDTVPVLQDILLANLYRFEFPRFDLFDYEEGVWDFLGMYDGVENTGNSPSFAMGWCGGYFNTLLTQEEINILAYTMIIGWLRQQLATVENTKLMPSGTEYKFSSQANHIAKLSNLVKEYKTDLLHMQRLYKRRKRSENGEIQSTLSELMSPSPYGLDASKRRSWWF